MTTQYATWLREKKKLNFDYSSRVVGLPYEGLDPRHMDLKYANVEECEKVWEVKLSNSHGFKYKKQCINLKVLCCVEELWPKVYQKGVITNNEIHLSFAKGILAKQKGLKVCWATFVAKLQYQGS